MSGPLQLLLAGRASITINANWGNTGPGASPQTSPSRTITAPGGTGTVRFNITLAPGAGAFERQLNAGAFTALVDEATLAVATGDTLRFRLTGASDAAAVQVLDNTTNAEVGTCSIITT